MEKTGKLYAAYKRWCEECGKSPKNSTKFGLEVSKFFTKEKTIKGWVYTGVLVSQNE